MVIERLPALLVELRNAPRVAREDIPRGPGIYLFSEGGTPIYVGQTRRLRDRHDDHTKSAGDHSKASFSFLIATKATPAAVAALNLTRKVLQEHPDFSPHLADAKLRVSRMNFQCINLTDPIERSHFEIYAALHLGTNLTFNSFETH